MLSFVFKVDLQALRCLTLIFSITELEIYDYPEDTIASELEEYFSGELQAKLKTSQTEIEQELENKGSLIVEFHQAGK